jgi:hypothetical protein
LLHCGGTKLTDLSRLHGFPALEEVYASDLRLGPLSRIWVESERASKLVLHDTYIRDIPSGILSNSYDDDCLPVPACLCPRLGFRRQTCRGRQTDGPRQRARRQDTALPQSRGRKVRIREPVDPRRHGGDGRAIARQGKDSDPSAYLGFRRSGHLPRHACPVPARPRDFRAGLGNSVRDARSRRAGRVVRP